MAIDPQRIGALAMQFMEQIEEKYGDEADLDALILIAGIRHGDQASVEFRASDVQGGAVPTYVLKGLVATIAEHV